MPENAEKLILKVAPGTIAKPQEIGEKGAKVVRFRAEDNQGNTRVYETWSESLIEFIKECVEQGKPVPADVAYSQKEGQGGTKYDHWKVIQCYREDGSPVKQKSFAGKGQSYGKSPEERKSIEDQTRAYIIADLYKAGTITKEDALVGKLVTWLSKLGEPLPVAEKKEEPRASKPGERKDSTSESSQADSKGFTNAGEFLKACLDNLGMNKSDVLEALSLGEISEIKDLNKTYQQLAEIKAKPLF